MLGVVRGMLKQALGQLEVIPLPVQRVYEESLAKATFPDPATLIGQLMACSGQFETVYIVLDALDECDEDQRIDILSLIDELLGNPSIRIMVTSRHHLQRVQPIRCPPLYMDINADDGDIRTYLWFHLERQEILSPGLKKEIVEVISQGAEGM